MSSNSSTSVNTPLYSPSLSSLTVTAALQICWRSRVGFIGVTVLAVTNSLILLPFCISILYLGFRRWRQRCVGTVSSHSDVFTYNMVVIELLNVGGSVLCCLGIHTNVPDMQTVGIYLLSNVFSGQMLFHILTCVERYMAVVHPVTYMGLKKASGIRIRNIVVGCVWMLSFLGMSSMFISNHLVLTSLCFSLVPIVLAVISFCSISVLCALIRPGPGEGGRNRQQVDKRKLRAFGTITIILGVLLMRFIINICVNALFDSEQMEMDDKCIVWLFNFWLCLPSSLVLPLLFLHRAGKLGQGLNWIYSMSFWKHFL